MKSLITLLLVLVSIGGYSQNTLDKLVFKKINEYRKSKGLVMLVWDNKTFNASKHHTTYLVENKVVCHTEKNNTATSKSRLEHHGVDFDYSGENCAKVIIGITKEYSSDEYLSSEIVDGWKNSPYHNKIMLGKNYTYGGVSCIKDTNSVYSTLNIYGYTK
jgi:uncharacterized protein YkwD